MAKLSHLPNELLASIFYHCPDMETAENLSSINRAMRNAWLDLSPASVDSIIIRSTPAFKYAERLAITQTKQDSPDIALDHPVFDDQSTTSGPTKAACDLVRASLRKHIKLADSTFSLLTETPYKDYGRYKGILESVEDWFKAYYLLCKATLDRSSHKNNHLSIFKDTEWPDIQNMSRIAHNLGNSLMAASKEYAKKPSHQWIMKVPIREHTEAYSAVYNRLFNEYKSRRSMNVS